MSQTAFSKTHWIGAWALLVLVLLSLWGLRGESASPAAPLAEVSAQIRATFSGLRYNRATRTYDTVATLANLSAQPILAPLQLHLTSITPATVSLQNPSGTTADGHPYLDVSLPTGELAPDATVTNVVLRFANPSNAKFTFSHAVFGVLPNRPPQADAGSDRTVTVGATVQLDGSGSSDADGDPLTYRWQLNERPAASAAALSDAIAIAPQLPIDKPGDYQVELTVNDSQADSAPDLVTISTENSPPRADAGPDRTAPLGATLILDGGASSDSDGDPLSYQWEILQRPSGSLFSLIDPTSQTPELTLDRPGDYLAQLIVHDGALASAPDNVTLSTLNSRPVAVINAESTGIPGQPATLDGTASEDSDGDLLSYVWALLSQPSGSTAGLTALDTATTAFTPDLAGDYVAQLIVNDGALDSEPMTARIEIAALPPVNQPPEINSTAVTTATVGQLYRYDVTASDDADPLTFSLETAPADMDLDAASGALTWTPATAGEFTVQLKVSDGRGGEDRQRFTLIVSAAPDDDLPPDPAEVAPPLDPTVATTHQAATQFLYTGPDPIQTGVAPGTIDPVRSALIRGRVLDRDNRPLPGVTVTVLDHPEFGQTRSREDGWFDLAVNGGGYLTVNYAKDAYLASQRQSNVPWQDSVVLDDVVLIGLDAQVTTIDLTDTATPIQIARGSPVTDSDGTRQATLLFSQGTTATVDGVPLTTLNIRATEYTVGDNGPEAMPGPLPANVGYTYAVELSADEALDREVRFSQPVLVYVENFLDFPVGGLVPVGWYDRAKAAWIPSDNGRIIKILGVTDGLADLDTNGDGNIDDAATLSALGVTEAERQQLAKLYSTGQSLWRVPITHFTPWDCNWPFGPPQDATPPNGDDPKNGDEDNPTDACEAKGSVIGCETQTLGESVPVVGTNFSLNYRSDRMLGRSTAHTLRIPLSGATVPQSLKRIEARVTVAGRDFDLGRFPAQANQTTTFTWDGLDSYQRMINGTQPATVTISYVYDGVYLQPESVPQSFGLSSGVDLPLMSRQEFSISRSYLAHLEMSDFKALGIGGWRFDLHHAYDPIGRLLYQGDGSRRTAQGVDKIISTVAGNVLGQSGGDGDLATQVVLDVANDVAVMADGSFLIAEHTRVRRVNSSGIISTFAGSGSTAFSGDGGPATQAGLYQVKGMAVMSDSSVLIADSGHNRIRRVASNGIITTFAGTGAIGSSGDGALATQATLNSPSDVAVMADGSVLIADTANSSIRRIDPGGIITTFAGSGIPGFDGDGGPATQAKLYRPEGLAVMTDGSVLIADTMNNRVRRVGVDGIITTVAGTDTKGFGGDGGLAIQAQLNQPASLAVKVNGSILIADRCNSLIRYIHTDGVITTLAGDTNEASRCDCRQLGGGAANAFCSNNLVDGGPAKGAPVYLPKSIALAPDRSVLIADTDALIRKISPSISGFTGGDIAIASTDGSQLYRFDQYGRHLSTVDALTDAIVYTFDYDSRGRLIRITDADHKATTLEYDGSGNPKALVAPFGQRTTLTVDAHGYLASVTNPAGETYRLQSTADGLLTTFTDPRNHSSVFTYDAEGRLLTDTNAAGGRQTLARLEADDGYSVTRTTALNRTTTYSVEELSTGDRQRRVRTPSGLETQTRIGADSRTRVVATDGTVIESQDDPDPRFGMQAPITSNQITVGDLTSTTTKSVFLEPEHSADPLSFTRLTEVTDVNGRSFRSLYDKVTRTTTVTSAAGRESYRILDDKGRLIEAGATGIAPIQLAYDEQGHLTRLTQGTGAAARGTHFGYNAAGELEAATDALGHIGTLDYDLAGRVTTQTLANGERITFGYDAKGNLTSLAPPGRPAHAFTYDAVDLTARYSPPAVDGGGDTHYAYNSDQQLTQVTRPDGGVLTYNYDAAGRLSTLTIPAGEYSYDYNAAGQLSRIGAPGGLGLAYGYSGSLLTSATWSGDIAGRVGFGYDNDFRVKQIDVNGANPIVYDYDADSLLTKAGDLTYARDPANGLLVGSTQGSVIDSYDYNDFGEPVAYSATYGGTSLLEIDYTRDPLGRIMQKVERVNGAAAVTYDYDYDAIGQLIEVKRNGAVSARYVYDANGNRLSKTAGGSPVTGTYDDQDRMLSYGDATYTYTPNGELKTKTEEVDQTTTYDYDALGNLRGVTLPNGTQITYLIDGKNRRVGKQVNGTLVQGFLYQDQLKPVAELDGAGTVVSRFVYGRDVNVPDYMIRDGATYRIVKDHLGSPRLVVNTATGAIAQQMEYDEYGNVLNYTNLGFQPFGFAGGIYDRDTGLVRFGARDYHLETGCWTIKDPILFAGDGSNFYQYVLNDPINSIDQSGLEEDSGALIFLKSFIRGGLPGGTVLDIAEGAAAGAEGAFIIKEHNAKNDYYLYETDPYSKDAKIDWSKYDDNGRIKEWSEIWANYLKDCR